MSIQQEISIVISACLSGITVCTLYNAIRVFRRIIKHSLFWVSMEDFIYWIWCGIYLFTEIHRTCSGQIRWYYVAGVLLGGGISGAIAANFIKKRIDNSQKRS